MTYLLIFEQFPFAPELLDVVSLLGVNLFLLSFVHGFQFNLITFFKLLESMEKRQYVYMHVSQLLIPMIYMHVHVQ